jgi:hypothetical protein
VGSVLTKSAQRAGVTKNVTFHVARLTFATNGDMSSEDLDVAGVRALVDVVVSGRLT